MLPGLDGWAVLQRLRQSKKTPVLMLTARDTPRDRVRGLDTGADDYVVKPFDLEELFARLRALIRRAAGKTQNRLEIGQLVIDTAARRVSRAGRPVELTAREYALVEFLALHRGEVVPALPSTNTCSTRMTARSPTCWTCMSRISARNWAPGSSPPAAATATALNK